MRTKLGYMVQTETKKERFFVGEVDEFFTEDGQPCQQKIMKRFDEIQYVIERRLERIRSK